VQLKHVFSLQPRSYPMTERHASTGPTFIPMSRRAVVSAILCAPIAACGGDLDQASATPPDNRELQPENQPLPVPPDQVIFQRSWRAARINNRTFPSPVLKEIPKDLNKWTGKMLVRSIANDQAQLLVVRIADNLGVVGYGYERRVLRAYAGNYVEFDATQLDDSLVWRNSDEVQVAGIWSLVKVKFNRITTPRLPHGPGL